MTLSFSLATFCWPNPLLALSFLSSASCAHPSHQGLWWTECSCSGESSLPGLLIISLCSVLYCADAIAVAIDVPFNQQWKVIKPTKKIVKTKPSSNRWNLRQAFQNYWSLYFFQITEEIFLYVSARWFSCMQYCFQVSVTNCFCARSGSYVRVMLDPINPLFVHLSCPLSERLWCVWSKILHQCSLV